MVKQNPKIHREKQKGKWAKQAREKVTLTFTISSARALSRLFSFWPCDEDSCFSTSCEICYKFRFVVQCKTRFKQNMQIEIPNEIADESPYKRRHSAGGLSDYDTGSQNISAISRVLFNILRFFGAN